MKDRVLFVDDDLNITRAFERIFYKDAIEVLTAQSGREALSILATQETAVVVSDQRMPGMTGSELLTEVSKKHPSTMRIMLTGYATLELTLEMINRAEVYRFLLKPCSFVELGQVVREAIERRRSLRTAQDLLATAKAQATLLDRIEEELPETLYRLAGFGDVDPEAEDRVGADLAERMRSEVARFSERKLRLRAEAPQLS